MIYYSGYAFFVLLSAIVFGYTSFLLNVANLIPLFVASGVVSSAPYANKFIKVFVLFVLVFIALFFVEYLLLYTPGASYGYGGKTIFFETYTKEGRAHVAQVIGLGVLLYFLGEILRIAGVKSPPF